MQVAIVGLDIAKHVFQLHGVDSNSKVVLRRRLHRQEVVPFFANLTLCVVGLEACDGAHYWARRLKAAGHTVRLIAPQFVKPFVKSNKNDANDAEAMVDILAVQGVTDWSVRLIGDLSGTWPCLVRLRGCCNPT